MSSDGSPTRDRAAPAATTPASAIERWARTQDAGNVDAGATLVTLVDGGLLQLPLPGLGDTRARWDAFRSLGRFDLSTARLAEGHCDALAIAAEAGWEPFDPGWRLGVWAAGPVGSLRGERRGGEWCLHGVRRWCSGIGSLTHALVTADVEGATALFLVDLADPGVLCPGTWPAVGMQGSVTFDARFDSVRIPGTQLVGEPGFYLNRPGFWHGGAGVAAVWLGGAEGIGGVLSSASLSPHAMAHAGAVAARLWSLDATLLRAAAEIDADPQDRQSAGHLRTLMVRHLVEAGCAEILERVGRATGAGPLGHDAAHARRVADLTVYLRQSHAELDLEWIGRALVTEPLHEGT